MAKVFHENNRKKQFFKAITEIQIRNFFNVQGSVRREYILIYRVIHKSLRYFQTRLRNNQDRHGRKEHINR
jgi:hypothetical protein